MYFNLINDGRDEVRSSFSHSQLYIRYSHVNNKKGLNIFAQDERIRNIIYKEAFRSRSPRFEIYWLYAPQRSKNPSPQKRGSGYQRKWHLMVTFEFWRSRRAWRTPSLSVLPGPTLTWHKSPTSGSNESV